MSGFSLVLIAILLIAVVKDELLGSWQAQLPQDVPNYFMINIRSDDVNDINEFLQRRQIESSTPYALVRARLSRINAVPVVDINFSNPRAANLVSHTFNISYTETLPYQNKIEAGEWIKNTARDFGADRERNLEAGRNSPLFKSIQAQKAQPVLPTKAGQQNFSPVEKTSLFKSQAQDVLTEPIR